MKKPERQNFGKLKEAIDPPNLIQNQVDSFHDFLQRDVPSTHKTTGKSSVVTEDTRKSTSTP